MKELPLPDGAADDPDAQEMARIWVTHADLLLSLNVGCYGGDGPGETTAWGDILADTIKHLAKAISQRTDISPLKAQQEIMARLNEALAAYQKDFSGQLKS